MPVRYPNPRPNLTIRRNLDGTTQDDYFEYGQSRESFVGSWQLYSQRTYDYQASAVFSGGTQLVTDCASAFASGATQCAPRRVRYFKPLKRVGDRMYGIEEFYTYSGFLRPPGDTAPFAIERKITRPNFHICVSASCTLPATMAFLDARKPAPTVTSTIQNRNFPYGRFNRAR